MATLRKGTRINDYKVEKLASQTEGYVASDIELIVNRAALIAARKDVPLSQELLEESRLCKEVGVRLG